jgi:Astacin (Peptidase family M12A)
MTDTLHDYRDTLAEIGRLAEKAINDTVEDPDTQSGGLTEAESCTIKSLPPRLLRKAAEVAVAANPLNAPVIGAIAGAADIPLEPMHLTLLTSKYWGSQPRQLTVSFVESTPVDLKTRILQHMNAWSTRIGISFVLTNGTGNVRISRGSGGFWSYLGTDIGLIPTNRQTMNLQGFTMNTPESEYRRVVRHETGHTLGFPHEHMRRELVARIDPQKAYDYFRRTQGWPKPVVNQQVLTPLDEASIIGTPADQTSIMCYQLPGSITKDGRPITGGIDINATDYAFAARIYPRQSHAGKHAEKEERSAGGTVDSDWDESEDVLEPELA